MTENILLIAFCVLGIFLLGYIIGWIHGQKAMMPIIEDYKMIIASYRNQLRDWHDTVESLTEVKHERT